MIQERYINEILSIVTQRKGLFEIKDKEIIFQKDNDESYDIQSFENCYIYVKDEMKLDYIDD